jgi:hypothetical protein
MSTETAGYAGAAGYTRGVLTWYDLFVLGIVCPVVWGCHRTELLRSYDRNVGARHLDLGPGTGYFLARCRFPVSRPELVVVDLNDNVLRRSARRLARYQPTVAKRDVLAPLELGPARFDSVGMSLLLHCLPGGMRRKAVVFDRVLPYAAPGCRIFGSTVLAHGVRHGPLARKALESLNGDETFHNSDDSWEQLDAELAARFTDYRLTARGSVCFFEVNADSRR